MNVRFFIYTLSLTQPEATASRRSDGVFQIGLNYKQWLSFILALI